MSGGQCTDAVHVAVFGKWFSGGESLIAFVEFFEGLCRCDVGGCADCVGRSRVDGSGERGLMSEPAGKATGGGHQSLSDQQSSALTRWLTVAGVVVN